MEAVRSWAFSVCSAVICGAVLNMILPEGSAQKTYKAVFCVFFLCILVAPLSELKIPDFDSLAKNIEGIENEAVEDNEFREISVSVIEDAVIADTKAILNDEDVVLKDISIKINISESGGIDINKFVLTLGYIENPTGLKEKICQKTGIMPEIIISEEN